MSDTLLYIISFLMPFLLVPMIMPPASRMAHRIKLTDKPNFRKLQRRPIAVMGGMVVTAVVCLTMVCMDIFVSMDRLFPAMCVIVILFVLGMIDDALDLKYTIKFVLQVTIILLLYFGGRYRAVEVEWFGGMNQLSLLVSLGISLFLGLYFINAINFIDGIDGLAAGLGTFFSVVIANWCMRHGLVEHALLSYAFCGALSSFFFFNVFSKRYKMFMGDSGSLVLGMYAYMSVCIDPSGFSTGDFVTDQYSYSLMLAVFSAPLLDLARVCVCRVYNHKSPFHPDRTHLHHILVDLGLSHLLSTLIIVVANVLVLLVWFVTVDLELAVALQAAIVLVAGFCTICLPYFIIIFKKKYRLESYNILCLKASKLTKKANQVQEFFRQLIDGKNTSQDEQ